MNEQNTQSAQSAQQSPSLLGYTVRSIALVAAFGTFMYLLGKNNRKR